MNVKAETLANRWEGLTARRVAAIAQDLGYTFTAAGYGPDAVGLIVATIQSRGYQRSPPTIMSTLHTQDLLTHLHENSRFWMPVVSFYTFGEFVMVELQPKSTRAVADRMKSTIESLGHTATVVLNTHGLRYGYGIKVS